jgi:SAM-dependent methyltransferase
MGTPVYFKYPPESNFGGLKVLNMGCGFAQFPAPNVVNLDAYDNCRPPDRSNFVKHDLSDTPLPFEDNTFDLIIANHIIEHIPNWWKTFCDCARILKVGGVIEIWVPGVGSDSILGYRDHINTINGCSFAGTFGTYRNKTNAWAENSYLEESRKLKLVKHYTRLINVWWLNRAPQFFKTFAAQHLRNVVLEDGYIFQKVSPTETEKEDAEHVRRSATLPLSSVRKAAVQ